jgi:hypothetical protein
LIGKKAYNNMLSTNGRNEMKYKIPDLPYHDWFGSGNTKEDIEEVILEKGEPLKLYIDGYLGCLVYPDKVIVVGYDGSEYTQFNTFDEEIQKELESKEE